MNRLPLLNQKILILIDEKPIWASLIGALLLLLVLILLAPFLFPIPVAKNVRGVTVRHPITAIPYFDREYEIVIRADEGIEFIVQEGNEYVTFLSKEDLLGDSQRQKITAIFSYPETNRMAPHYAVLRLEIRDVAETRFEYVTIRLDTYSPIMRIILSVFLATPSLQIFGVFWRRSSMGQSIGALLSK
jgi:hypothetical protein